MQNEEPPIFTYSTKLLLFFLENELLLIEAKMQLLDAQLPLRRREKLKSIKRHTKE